MRLFHVDKRQLTCLFLGCYKFWNSVSDFRTRIPTSSISMAAKLLGASLISPSHPNVGNRTFRHQFGTNFAPTSAAPAFKKLSVRVLTRNEYYSILNELNQPPKPAHGIDRRTLSKTDLSNSARDGGQLRVAYQGVSGAFSESAAAKAYPHCITVPCEQFEIAFEAVEKMVADRAVLPIENSVGGSIHRNYDLLLRHRLHIVGEVELAVRHCLLANHGVKVEHLRSVISHQQALYQSEYTLAKLKVEKMAVADTAGAAKFVALHKLRDTGAVASIDAAKIYDLNVLAQDIQDYSDNVTRFLMLAREPIISLQGTAFKTSIVFSLDEGSGMLYKALAVFAMRNINLTKIESRPQKKHPLRLPAENSTDSKYFDYLFYCDFEASMSDINAQNALNHLKEFATFLRVLGSYPKDVSP